MPLAWLMVTSSHCSSSETPGLLRHQRLQVLVEDLGLLVGQVLEALERLVVAASSLSSSMPSSFRRCLKALRPESLPSTILLVAQPTSSAVMIS